MTKSTITRERLEQLADNNTICKVSWDERIELAQIALAAMDSKPVVPDEKPMPNSLSMYAVDAVAAIAEVRGWNACRSAMLQASPVCTCPSGDGSLRWPCPVHPGNSPAIPDGYVMVPKEPTDEMLAAAKEWTGLTSTAEVVYIKMLAAAPQEVKGE